MHRGTKLEKIMDFSVGYSTYSSVAFKICQHRLFFLTDWLLRVIDHYAWNSHSGKLFWSWEKPKLLYFLSWLVVIKWELDSYPVLRLPVSLGFLSLPASFHLQASAVPLCPQLAASICTPCKYSQRTLKVTANIGTFHRSWKCLKIWSLKSYVFEKNTICQKDKICVLVYRWYLSEWLSHVIF